MFIVFHQLQVVGCCFGNFICCVFVLFNVKSCVAQLFVAFGYVKLFVHDYNPRAFVSGFNHNVCSSCKKL